jgi:hypothetical protein
MPTLAALVCGFIFGTGLVVSGMTDTAKVLGFLDLPAMRQGGWDPTLLIVMATALIVSIPGFWLARRRERPLLSASMAWPARSDVDRPLIAGAVRCCSVRGGASSGSALARLSPTSPRCRRRSCCSSARCSPGWWRTTRGAGAEPQPGS